MKKRGVTLGGRLGGRSASGDGWDLRLTAGSHFDHGDGGLDAKRVRLEPPAICSARVLDWNEAG
jgi:hypothetical protein